MLAGCSALKLILKNFANIIKSNITAHPGIGVDISREERWVSNKGQLKCVIIKCISQKFSHFN